MSNDLDSILSGNSTAAPETVEKEQVTQVAEGESQQQPIDDDNPQVTTDERGQKMVPIQALDAKNHKIKRYTEQVASFEQTLKERDAAAERRFAELLQRIPVPKVEQPLAPDFFENPGAATRHEVQQTVSPQFEQINQTLLAIARDNAETRFTPETVNEAEQAFISAMQSKQLDPADYQKVVSSPNRYAAAVQWHKRQLAQAEIGDDPAAFRAKLETELREKITAELQGDQGQQTQQRPAPVMPSNLAGARNVGARSGPAWSGPTTLNDIFSRARPSG